MARNLRPGERMVYELDQGTGLVSNGNMWGYPHVALAIAEDGKLRRVRLNQQADTVFSWPGRASIKGRTVTGFVMVENGILRFYTND